MKHHLFFSLSLLLLIVYPIYGYEVSTAVQKKKILLEEFTGINCGNCPDGHAIANALSNAQFENSYIVAIHSGSYANGIPDFRTEAGETLDKEMEAYRAGYPCGMVNRTLFKDISSNVLISRSQWIKKSKIIREEDAPVNLWIKSTYDDDNKQLKIKVEGYYTSEVSEAKHYLNVLWTQNNILGPQNGARVDPGQYVHKHMLRGFITPVFGDEITPKKEEYFTKEYIYDIPAEVRSIRVKPEDIEVIAFVTIDKRTVLNVTGGKPDYKNYSKPLSARLYAPDIEINGRYGYQFFEAKLANESNQILTSATFKVNINEEEQEVNWTGNIPPFALQPVRIQVNPYIIKGSNHYKISLSALNGTAVESNTLEGDFSKPIESSPTVFIELKTDKFAAENTYSIKDGNGSIIMQFGPYKNGESAIYKERAELEANKNYCFEITDAWGDGIQNPPGYIKLYNDNNDLIAQNYTITLMGTRAFFTTNLPSSIEQSKQLQKDDVTIAIENENLTVNFNPWLSGNTTFTIYSLTGDKVLTKHTYISPNETFAHFIPLNGISKGTYLFNISIENSTKTYKVLIQ